MGCCQSAEDSDSQHSPRPAIPAAAARSPTRHGSLRHDSSRAAIINRPSRSLSNVNSTRGSSLSQAPRAPGEGPPSPTIGPPPPEARLNQPLRPPSPIPTSPSHLLHCPAPPWPRSILTRERAAFFDTRVTGDAEIWKALRLVSELLRRGDLTSAQGILDAVNVTCPHGRVASGRSTRDRVKGGVYDERGELYDLPAWVVGDPEDLIEDEEKDGGEATEGEEVEGEEEEKPPPTPSSSLPTTPGPLSLRREEKGKERAADIGTLVQLRCRLSDRGTDVVIPIGTQQRIALIVRSIREQIGGKRVRLMYLGKTLDEGKTLEQTAWQPGHVVNALVYEGDEAALLAIAAAKKAART